MPCHWIEETRFTRIKFLLVRVVGILQIAVGIVYLQYRARDTIGVFESSRHPAMLTYQYFFFAIEVISVFSLTFRLVEAYRICRRNCIDFKTIPNDLIAPNFSRPVGTKVRPQFSNYPSVGIFIPCYTEEVDLVLETVLGSLHMDYPKELLTVYLCDDGKREDKRTMVSQLRKQHKNLHYVIRPDNSHAKAGNLNFSLRRTSTDLVVTLDADFIARPNLLQRLIPYFYVWNPALGMYEFNETLAVVQTPQYFRNLSPYDSDPLDQRSTFFFELVLPGKDWFNASTMIGTTNMISRAALEEADYYPYHSITEDTSMSLVFHSLGYRSYFVNESLAAGLATTSLWSNLRQRARWLKGDWQILFSRKGPLSAKGLTLVQRFLYLHMTFARLISIIHLFYDICAVVLLVGGIPPLDAPDAKIFLIYIGVFLAVSILGRVVITSGGQGLEKSESGAVVFEAIFRYTIFKGLFIALFKGDNLQFKVTEKTNVTNKSTGRARPKSAATDDSEDTDDNFDHRKTVVGNAGTESGEPRRPSTTNSQTDEVSSSAPSGGGSDRQSMTSTAQEDEISDDDDGRSHKKKVTSRTPTEKAERRRDILKNLKRIWFNILLAVMLTFSIVWGTINPPRINETDGENIVPFAMALGFACANLLPHLLAIYLCFIPYLSGWVMTDLVHGRCDQYAVHPKTGKIFVPWSFISLLQIARFILIIGSMAALGVFSFRETTPEEVAAA